MQWSSGTLIWLDALPQLQTYVTVQSRGIKRSVRGVCVCACCRWFSPPLPRAVGVQVQRWLLRPRAERVRWPRTLWGWLGWTRLRWAPITWSHLQPAKQTHLSQRKHWSLLEWQNIIHTIDAVFQWLYFVSCSSCLTGGGLNTIADLSIYNPVKAVRLV